MYYKKSFKAIQEGDAQGSSLAEIYLNRARQSGKRESVSAPPDKQSDAES
jgi:hypothetical protein